MDLYPKANLDSEIVKTYFQNGHVTIPLVLEEEQTMKMKRHLEWVMEKNPTIEPELLNHQLMRDDPFWINLVTKNQKLLDIAELFLGPNIAVFASHYVCKMPKTGKKIHWHQDGSYWPLTPMQVLSLWVCVDDSNKTNGCVQYASKSHLNGIVTQGLSAVAFENHVNEVHKGKETDFSSYVNDKEIVFNEVKSGDVALHHPFLFHCSDENFSETRRCGLTIRYISTSTAVGKIKNMETGELVQEGSCYLARGQADPNVANVYLEIPNFDAQKHFSSS
jgi:hypothetical protein